MKHTKYIPTDMQNITGHWKLNWIYIQRQNS